MSLPTTGPISTNDIIGPNGLNIAPGTYSFAQLWSMAAVGSIPKNKANAGGPYVLPDDWYGYNNAIAYNYLSPGYLGTNGLGGINNTFSISRTNYVGIVSGGISAGCYRRGAPNDYNTYRTFVGYNTSALTAITAGGIKFTMDSAGPTGRNKLNAPARFVLVATNPNFAYNHAWVGADFPTAILPGGGLGNTIISEIITINPGQIGDIFIPFNSTGLNYVNANNSSSIVIMEYDHDWLNVAPVTIYSNDQSVNAFNTDCKLYY